MFTNSAFVSTELTPDRLLITMPGSALGWPSLHLFIFSVFLVVTYASSRTVRRVERPLIAPEKLNAYVWRYRAMMMGIGFLSIGVWSLIGYSSGSIELDRRANLATMRAKMTAFLPAETGSVPLSAVDEATLEAIPNARRIRLISNSGEDLAFPMWTGRAGQAEAVRAINQFLGCKSDGGRVHGEVRFEHCRR
jgi:hypothetical protein